MAVNGHGPPKIRRKVKALEKEMEQIIQPAANPWANLDQNGAGMDNLINEDELMKDSEINKNAKKFCDINDKMQGAKPCANCSCGLKE